jgi:hypothetical protein
MAIVNAEAETEDESSELENPILFDGRSHLDLRCDLRDLGGIAPGETPEMLAGARWF